MMHTFRPSYKMSLFRRPIHILSRALRSANRRVVALERRLGADVLQNDVHNAAVIVSTIDHDMFADRDEVYYRDQYWSWIDIALRELGTLECAVGLDLGCGQGRLTTLLGRRLSSGRVFGVDLSQHAVAAAKTNADALGISNVQFSVRSIEDALRGCASESVDVVMMIEVTFFFPRWREAMDDIVRVLKPGGIACIAFRSQYFDALCMTREGMLEQTGMLLGKRAGALFGGGIEFTWQTSSEVKALLQCELRLEILNIVGIGCCSGIKGDPHADIARPGTLDDEDRNALMRLERSLGSQVPDAGRYMLGLARKPRMPADVRE